jgi:hypothetical protein
VKRRQVSQTTVVSLTPPGWPEPYPETLVGAQKPVLMRLRMVQLTSVTVDGRPRAFTVTCWLSRPNVVGDPTESIRYAKAGQGAWTRSLGHLPEQALDLLATEPLWQDHLTTTRRKP